MLASIRSDPGNVSLNTMLTEIAKLEAVRTVGLPDGVFADIAPKVVAAWRGRAAVEAPSHPRDHLPEVTLTLLAALLYGREREITDQRTVKATLKASYTNHYRAGLIKLLDVLEFRSNTTLRPVLDALDLIARYASAGNLHYYPVGEHIPVHRGLGADWDALVHKTDTHGRSKAEHDQRAPAQHNLTMPRPLGVPRRIIRPHRTASTRASCTASSAAAKSAPRRTRTPITAGTRSRSSGSFTR